MSFINDEQFGNIVDFNEIRNVLRRVYDAIVPEFNLLETMNIMAQAFDDSPSHLIAAGASMLAYQMIPAAGDHELAEEVKGDGNIFSLGWTEEHCGSDLLSLRTAATPASDDPDERDYHIKGNKWMINNSYHADYHLVLAKLDPEQNGPRSLSLFLVPRSSTKNWERLETHVLRNMVLTRYDIDGPGKLVGKKGHGLSIVQSMAVAARFQCTYVGMRMLNRAIPETINWLSTKNIFGDNPVNFSNVFRQLYNLSLQAATLEFTFYRAYALSHGSSLQFYGTMMKSYLLLRINEVLSKNLLVAGSKGFVQESIIGRNVIDSFVLPVFDGHYTLNTFMSAKHAPRYLSTDETVDPQVRVGELREAMYVADAYSEFDANPRDMRKPDFIAYVKYIEQVNPPIDLPARTIIDRVTQLLNEIQEKIESPGNDPEFKYKTGDLTHWLEAIIAAVDLWAVSENDNYLNAIIIYYNQFVTVFNDVVSEGNFETAFLTPMRQLPLPDHIDDPQAFLLDLCNIEAQVKKFSPSTEPATD